VAEGYEGVDREVWPDVKWHADLTSFPWRLTREGLPPIPLADSSVTAARCSHFVEHLVDLVGFMRELYRVCENGAEVFISHPYQFNVRAWQDPTHVRAINEVSWFYFDRAWRTEAGQYGGYGDTDFVLENLDAIPESNWLEVCKNTPAEFERAARNQINVISDLHVMLRCRK